MKAAIALISDYAVQNIARRMVYELQQFGDVRFYASSLPSHVSLKQPFTFENMDVLENWFDSFSRRVAPVSIELDRVYYNSWDDVAILGFDVHETPTLRSLHDQINNQLKDLVVNSSAPHDGDEYRFHLTIELGHVGRTNPFKQYYDSLPEKELQLSFRAEYLALFFYADGEIKPGSFVCYKVLPLLGS
jgi:2'-5' RNA ligase